MANLYEVQVTKTWKSSGSGPSVLRAQTAYYKQRATATTEANAITAVKALDANGSDNAYDFIFHVRTIDTGIAVGS